MQVSVEITETSPECRPVPEPVLVAFLLDLRTAREQMAVGPVEGRVVEDQVLRTGLGVNVDTPRLGGLDEVGPLRGRHVDDIEPAAGDLGPGDGTLNRLGFDEVGTR